jgi:hypothetical protein
MIKKISLSFVLSVCTLISFGTVHTVDNTAGSGAQFTSISAAINAASSGDTLLVHSSQNSYGSVQINKHVVLIGPGHHPEVNNFLPATVGAFQLINGSDNTTIEGFVIGFLESPVFQNANNITVRNNYFNGITWIAGPYGDFSNADNWLIEGNVMIGASGCSGCTLIDIRSSAGVNDNWTIRNNYFQSDYITNGNVMINNANSTTVFANNIFVHNNTTTLFNNGSFAGFQNNIFWMGAAQTDVTANCVNCNFEYNLFYSPNSTINSVSGIGNIMNEDPQFADLNNNTMAWNYDNDYHFAPSSPAIGAAADGDDLGLYGADYNFRMFGYTNDVPRMTQVLPQYIVVPVDGTFTIDFSAIRAGQ